MSRTSNPFTHSSTYSLGSATARTLIVALVSALSVWTAMLAWRPLTEGPWTFLGPLLACTLVLGTTGGLLRWAGAHPALVAVVQFVVASAALLQVTAGSPVPTPDAVATTVDALRTATESASLYAMPVPLSPAPVTPLFLTAGICSVLLADLALTARRVPLVGVPLMVVLLVPTNLTQDTPWWLLALVGGGYLVQLRLDRVGTVAGWGRDAGTNTASARLSRLGTTLGLGAVALTCAVVVGTVVPVADHGLAGRTGLGSGGGDEVRITNPLIDMRRNLTRGADVPLLTVRTPGPRPTYLATTVLADYNGSEWTSGDRNATTEQRADGHETPPQGVDPAVRRTEHSMEVTALPTFNSRWLALPQHATRVDAEGDWRRDVDTQDYVAWDKDLTTAGLNWSAVATAVELDHLDLDRAPSGRTSVPSTYTRLPSSLPPEVERITEEVTAEASTAFRRARALQEWFRSEFTYSLDRVRPVGNNELLAFLSESGREGYCEQFAGAMAVMARTLGIPSRVVVGFLSPEQVAPGTWEFSAHDLHAWPELYFPDAGWVRFEPTPGDRTDAPPSYTIRELPSVDEPVPTTSPSPSTSVSPEEETNAEDPEAAPASRETESSDVRLLWWGAGLLVLVSTVVAVAAAPRFIRRRRRQQRYATSTTEDLWEELRDQVIDLGLAWPEGRSPRETGQAVEAHLPHATTPEGDGPRDALARLVNAVERDRYAPPAPTVDPGTTLTAARTATTALVDDLRRCSEALVTSVGISARRRARWWPRSVFTRQ